jgi:hypothetical protein
MTTIGPPGDLVAYLQAQLANARLKPAAASEPGIVARGDKAHRSRQEPARSGQSSQERLAASIARRVVAIDRSDPQRRRKAFRAFLESVMLEEWGEELINDPAFHELVAQVHAQMEGRDDLRSMMDEAADQLLAKS